MTEILTRPATTTRAEDPSADPADPQVYTKRKLKAVRRTDWLALVGAAGSALSLTGLLFFVLTPISSLLGFVAVAYVAFLVIFALLVSFDERGPVVADRLATVVAWSLGCLLFTVLFFVIGYTLTRGVNALGHGNFYTEDNDPGRSAPGPRGGRHPARGRRHARADNRRADLHRATGPGVRALPQRRRSA